HLAAGECGHVVLAEVQLPGGGRYRPDEQLQQRGFAGPVRADDAGDLPGTQAQVHALQQGRRVDAIAQRRGGESGDGHIGGLRAPRRAAGRRVQGGLIAHVRLRLRISSQAKTGAPRAAVRIPTGTSAGAKKLRAPVSAHSRKSAPIRALAGSRRVCRAPSRSRTTCGLTRPMNPIDPLTATIAPTSSAVSVSIIHRVACTCTPREEAAVSPKAKASSVRARVSRKSPITASVSAAIPTEFQVAPAIDPISQLMISR